MREAVRLLDERGVDFEYDGEMAADVALDPELRARLYPFCRLTGPANVLVMPGLHAAHILTKAVPRLTSGTAIGPLLMGLSRPVQIVPMDASVNQMLDMACLAAHAAIAALSPLFTIGYAERTPAGLIGALQAAGVTGLVDVRALANSRRPGFAKTALAAALAEAGIGYQHVKALGTPAAGRAAVRAGRPAEMRRIFAAHLAGVEPQAALAGLTERAGRERLCLLCLEADPAQCHRTLVAEAVAAAGGVAVTHL